MEAFSTDAARLTQIGGTVRGGNTDVGEGSSHRRVNLHVGQLLGALAACIGFPQGCTGAAINHEAACPVMSSIHTRKHRALRAACVTPYTQRHPRP